MSRTCAAALLGCLATMGPARAQCVAEAVAYRGWDAIHLGNGIVDLWVVPDIGGRIIQVQCDGHEYFYVNPDLAGRVVPQVDAAGEKLPWPNYGGDKLWPAPQGPADGRHWPGPGDPVLDGGRFESQILRPGGDTAAVRLVSPPDTAYTGVRFSREITLHAGESRVHIVSGMRNVIDRPVRWSIWEVAQIDAAGAAGPGYNDALSAYVPASPVSRHPRGFYVMYGLWRNPAWQRPTPRSPIRVDFSYQIGKIGVDSDAGWLSVIDGRAGRTFTQVFPHEPGAAYPDQGSSVEFWINGAGSFNFLGSHVSVPADPRMTPPYLEAEVLSPLVTLAPGEEAEAAMTWGLGSAQGEPISATSEALVCGPAEANADAGAVRVRMALTPFIGGRLHAVLVDGQGQVVAERELAVAVPGARRCVDVRMADRSGAAAGARVVIVDRAGKSWTLAAMPVNR